MANASLNVQGEMLGWDGSDLSAFWAALAQIGAGTPEPPPWALEMSVRSTASTRPVWTAGMKEIRNSGRGCLLGWVEIKREEKKPREETDWPLQVSHSHERVLQGQILGKCIH